jgi:hypothetical protein
MPVSCILSHQAGLPVFTSEDGIDPAELLGWSRSISAPAQEKSFGILFAEYPVDSAFRELTIMLPLFERWRLEVTR